LMEDMILISKPLKPEILILVGRCLMSTRLQISSREIKWWRYQHLMQKVRVVKPCHAGHVTCLHGRMARGGHGFPKVSPGPAMSYPYGLMTVSGATCGHLLPLWTTHAVRLCVTRLTHVAEVERADGRQCTQVLLSDFSVFKDKSTG
jgi:hypothetical protein